MSASGVRATRGARRVLVRSSVGWGLPGPVRISYEALIAPRKWGAPRCGPVGGWSGARLRKAGMHRGGGGGAPSPLAAVEQRRALAVPGGGAGGDQPVPAAEPPRTVATLAEPHAPARP